jgi:hypothetical protein
MYIPVRVYVSSCRRGTEDKGMFTLTEAERADHKPAARAGAAHLRASAGKQHLCSKIHLHSNSLIASKVNTLVYPCCLFVHPTEEKDEEKGRASEVKSGL